MARINIEDSLWLDPRFLALSSSLGKWAAMGVMVDAFKIAQGYWVQGKLIPEDLWPMYNLPPQIEQVGLIERRSGGIYVRGSEEQFAWLVQRSNAGKRNKGRSNEIRHLDRTEIERNDNGSRTEVVPQSPSPSPSLKQNKEEELNLSPCFDAWGITLSKFGIHKDPRTDEFTILRLVKTHGVEKTRLALLGYGNQEKFDGYDPKKYCRITHLLKPDKFELCVNLGAQQTETTWVTAREELEKNAIQSDQ